MDDRLMRDLIEAVEKLGHFVSYSEAEAANHLGIEAPTLKKMRLRGEIRYTRVAKKGVRYLPSHLYDYMKRNTV